MAITRSDPYGAFNFLVEIDGATVAAFSEVSGLDQEIEVIAYRSGGDALGPRLLPGLARPATVTLRRGVDGDLELQNWFDAVRNGEFGAMRRNVAVRLLNEAREPVLSWLLRRAWPTRIEGPRLDARTSATAIETLVLAVEGISVE